MRTKLTLTAAFVALTFGQAAFAANQILRMFWSSAQAQQV